MKIKWARLALYPLLGLLLSVGIVELGPKQYRSSAVMRLHLLSSAAKGDLSPHLARWQENALTDDFLKGLAARFSLYQDLPAATRLRRTQQDVSIEVLDGYPEYTFEVAFSGRDRFVAQQITREIIGRLVETNASYNAAHFPQPGGGFELIEGASLPERPAGPGTIVFALCGLCGGLTLSAISFIRQQFQTPKTP